MSHLYEFDIKYKDGFGDGNGYIAGIDEAGRGSLAGPVVAACVILNLDIVIPFLDDSKKLSVAKRLDVFSELEKGAAISIGTGVVDCDVIDKVNILNASKQAMYRAYSSLKVKPSLVLIDAVKLSKLDIKSHSIIKGDTKSASIAAASVVAKLTRDRIMTDLSLLYPAYSFAKNKAYPTKEHLEALKRHGICKVHRKSYRPVKDIIENNNAHIV